MSQNNILQTSSVLAVKQNNSSNFQKINEMKPSSKRPATSPAKGAIHKRSALGNITNAGIFNAKQVSSKQSSKKIHPMKENTKRRRSLRILSKNVSNKPAPDLKPEAHKISALSDDFDMSSSQGSNSSSVSEEIFRDILEDSPIPTCFYEHNASPSRKQLNFNDIDFANSNNINEAPEYAFTIFEYMRVRERSFIIKPEYMSTSQKELTADMRAILVDWMVEVQENFELNHETLYLAVKLVDHYLQKVNVARDRLQLVGATSLLIAAKFDERHPPYVDDFLYICDDAYTRRDMLTMERAVLSTVGFDINIPIAYRFLRRYAKCLKSSMEVLTLARFVLELSLQRYAFVDRSASLMAAAALWLAIKMKQTTHEWNDTLLYYTTHTEQDVFALACELSAMIADSKQSKLKTIWQKYSHSVFYEVAKIPALSSEKIDEERRRVFDQLNVTGGKDMLQL